MKILVFGAGAVGSYFGGLLAKGGAEVRFLARGARADALERHGLSIISSNGETRIGPVRVLRDLRALEAAPDVTLLCVKTHGGMEAARALAASPGAAGIVVSLQNGVDAAERLGSILPALVPGIAFVSATMDDGGRVTMLGSMSSIVTGHFPPGGEQVERAFANACADAGFGFEAAGDIDLRLWRKFVLLASNAALTALSRRPAGYVYHDPDMRQVARLAVLEVIALARAEGVAIPDAFAEEALAQAEGFPADMYASMYHDLADGRPMELHELSGLVVTRARRHGLSVPVHEVAYAALKPFAAGGQVAHA